MNALVILLVGLLIWCWSRLQHEQKERQNEHAIHQKTLKDHQVLTHTLSMRGQRLDVLLSSVSEVVLRVDRLGRVLGGNDKAKDLFQWGKLTPLPQAMLIFYRNHDWLKQYQHALTALPNPVDLPEIKLQQRVLMPKLVPLGEKQALLLCMDVTAYVRLQRQQKTLLSNLMHDLKTPLTSLLGYARSIESFVDDKDLCQEAAAVIAQEAKHINSLMNSMLSLEQIDQQQDKIVPCDVIAVFNHVLQTLSPNISDKNISMQLSFPAHASARMFEEDCKRLLMNITENAVKFSPQSAVLKCIVTMQQDWVEINIKDEGCGISEQHITRVTERFYRVNDVRGRQEQGHGLGLAIAQEILTRDGGHLSLENRKNGGLSVFIKIKRNHH